VRKWNSQQLTFSENEQHTHAIYIYVYATDDSWTGQGYGENVDSFHCDTFWPGVSWNGGGGGGTTLPPSSFCAKEALVGSIGFGRDVARTNLEIL
jgi:hypothetical protein